MIGSLCVMTMNLTIFTVFASLLIILSRARKPGEELCCTALRSVQKSDFIAVIITNLTNLEKVPSEGS